MDCLVTATQGVPGSGVKVEITGSSAARFKSAMEKKVNEVVVSLGAKDIDLSIQDNGAIDLVLGARVEAALKKLMGGAK